MYEILAEGFPNFTISASTKNKRRELRAPQIPRLVNRNSEDITYFQYMWTQTLDGGLTSKHVSREFKAQGLDMIGKTKILPT